MAQARCECANGWDYIGLLRGRCGWFSDGKGANRGGKGAIFNSEGVSPEPSAEGINIGAFF